MNQQNDDYVIFSEIRKVPSETLESRKLKQPILGDYPNLYNELKSKCNPAMFMHPYDREKIDIANDIFHKLCMFSPHFVKHEELIPLRNKAIHELGIKISTIKLYTKLEKACNPQNFTGKNYDAQKLKCANDLYARIIENADNIDILEDIEMEAQEYIKIQHLKETEKERSIKEVEEFYHNGTWQYWQQ